MSVGVSRANWSALLSLLGLGVAGYLTLTHYAQDRVPLACATGGVVDCEAVTSSAASMLGPLPVAVLGVAWFAVQLGLVLVHASNRLQLAWTGLGLAFVFYLVFAELFLVGAICLWCTAVHVLVVALFLVAVAESSAERVEVAA